MKQLTVLGVESQNAKVLVSDIAIKWVQKEEFGIGI